MGAAAAVLAMLGDAAVVDAKAVTEKHCAAVAACAESSPGAAALCDETLARWAAAGAPGAEAARKAAAEAASRPRDEKTRANRGGVRAGSGTSGSSLAHRRSPSG
jgi:hypothetical protein